MSGSSRHCRAVLVDGYNPGDDRDRTVERSRLAGSSTGRPPAPRGRDAAGRSTANHRRAVHLRSRRRAALRHAPDEDRGADRDDRGRSPRLRRAAAPPSRRSPRHDDRAGRRNARQLRALAVGWGDGPDLRGCPQARHQTARADGRSGSGRSGPARDLEGLRPADGPADGDPARDVRPSGRLLPERPRDRPLPGHRGRRGRRSP